MKLILLSGNSFSHKEWIIQVENNLKDLFDDTYIQFYKHWEDKSTVIQMDYELDVLEQKVKTFGSEPYMIFGKSAGTLLALNGISRGSLLPRKCFFVGLPVEWGRSVSFDVDNWIRGYSVPTLFVQKTADPAMHYETLEKYLITQGVGNYTLVEVPGNDHYYGDLGFLKSAIADFLK